MSQSNKKYDCFEYFEEDCGHRWCLFYRGKKLGCEQEECCCDDIRADAIANGRFIREREWNKQCPV